MPGHERRFYSRSRAFGRLGMRIFTPGVMDAPHWHGHIEFNLLRGAEMSYDMDGARVEVPEGRLVVFWAGIPHRLTAIRPMTDGQVKLANLYIPLDSFLTLPHIAGLQVALLGGAVAVLPERLYASDQMERWLADYRSGDLERLDVMRMEVNTLLRRGLIDGMAFLREPLARKPAGGDLSPAHVGHLVEMVRHILENLDGPLSNSDVTAVTGLHENYALSIFSKAMRVPMKRFIIRMRLIRARALLAESAMPISMVAEASGFTSISQFYAHFRQSYGLPPHALRRRHATGPP